MEPSSRQGRENPAVGQNKKGRLRRGPFRSREEKHGSHHSWHGSRAFLWPAKLGNNSEAVRRRHMVASERTGVRLGLRPGSRGTRLVTNFSKPCVFFHSMGRRYLRHTTSTASLGIVLPTSLPLSHSQQFHLYS